MSRRRRLKQHVEEALIRLDVECGPSSKTGPWGTSVRLRRAVIPAAILAVLAALSGALLWRPVESVPITPSIEVGQDRVPVGGALEITYVWTLEPGAKASE